MFGAIEGQVFWKLNPILKLPSHSFLCKIEADSDILRKKDDPEALFSSFLNPKPVIFPLMTNLRSLSGKRDERLPLNHPPAGTEDLSWSGHLPAFERTSIGSR